MGIGREMDGGTEFLDLGYGFHNLQKILLEPSVLRLSDLAYSNVGMFTQCGPAG